MSTTYPFTWAARTTLEFLEKYGRATETFAYIIGISYETCCRSLTAAVRNDQRRWEMLKHVIKNVHRHEELFSCRQLTIEQKRKYLSYVKYDAQDHLIDGKKMPFI